MIYFQRYKCFILSFFLKQYNINDASSVKQFEGNNFLSETVMFLLLGTEGGRVVEQVEKFFNIKACYVFIFPR